MARIKIEEFMCQAYGGEWYVSPPCEGEITEQGRTEINGEEYILFTVVGDDRPWSCPVEWVDNRIVDSPVAEMDAANE